MQIQQGAQLAQTVSQLNTHRAAGNSASATSWSTHNDPPPYDEPVRSAPTPSAAAQESIYEATRWQILIDGKPILRLVSFDMTEKFRQHTEFSLRVYYGHVEEVGSYRIDQSKDLVGKTLTAILGTHLQDDHIQFTGIITQVSMLHANGLNGDVIIRGYSPTILLEGGEHRHSFYNKTLEGIAKEVVADLSGKLEVAIQPRYGEKIAYSAQHRESSFAYLARMASWFGEWLYYDGRKLCLGRPARLPQQTLSYGRQLDSLQMDMQVLPLNTIYSGYVSSQDKVLNMYPHQSGVAGLSFYSDVALEKAQQMYPQPVKTYPLQRAGDMGTLLHVASVNKASVAGNTLILSGTCRVPTLSIGTRVKIMMGPQESQVLGEYLVTEVSHCLQSGDRYQAHFKAVYGNLEVIPGPILQAPPAEAQLAVVRKNDDPRGEGRVRVQFQWQEGDNMSDWIRVLTPDAGGSGEQVAKNRGFVFVPEVGDLVMVGFRDGNCDAPYVSGSLHHGHIAAGGGKANKTKSLTTRSGSQVTLDDEAGSVTVSDPSGNRVVLHGDGTLTISAPKRITIQSEQVQIVAKKDLHLVAGKALEVSSGGTLKAEVAAESTVSLKGGIKTQAKSMETTVDAQLKIQSGEVAVNASGKVNITGADVNVV